MELSMGFLKNKNFFKKAGIILLIVLLMFFMKKAMSLLLLTFVLTYLINEIQRAISKNIKRIIPVNDKVITAFIYILILIVLSTAFYMYVPKIIKQGREIMGSVSILMKDPAKYAKEDTPLGKELIKLIENTKDNNEIYNYIQSSANGVIKFIINIGKWGFNIFIALILSFLFMIDKGKIIDFVKKFKDSKISFIYNELYDYYKIFINSFGRVIEAQILIAIANTILSVIGLIILRFHNIFFLAIMVFVLSLIPVAGVIISCIPLSLMAFNIGGFKHVLYLIVLITIIHLIESYFLNPKFMAYKTKLPVFIVFLVLILSEHLLGPWGLFFGLPLFTFILELVKDNSIKPTA